MQQVVIIIEGELDLHWADWLENLTLTHIGDGRTELCGFVVDPPALYGLLAKLRDLGLSLVSVQTSDVHPNPSHSHEKEEHHP